MFGGPIKGTILDTDMNTMKIPCKEGRDWDDASKC
jgi:hypothetical protein